MARGQLVGLEKMVNELTRLYYKVAGYLCEDPEVKPRYQTHAPYLNPTACRRQWTTSFK